MAEFSKDRIDAIPLKPEHIISEAMKKPPEANPPRRKKVTVKTDGQ